MEIDGLPHISICISLQQTYGHRERLKPCELCGMVFDLCSHCSGKGRLGITYEKMLMHISPHIFAGAFHRITVVSNIGAEIFINFVGAGVIGCNFTATFVEINIYQNMAGIPSG